MQIIKYVCLKHLKRRWDSSLLLGPTLTLSQTELKKDDSCSPGAAVNFHADAESLNLQHLWKEDVWGAAAFVLVCPQTETNLLTGATSRRRGVSTELYYEGERANMRYTISLWTSRRLSELKQAEVHLQAPPTLTNKTLWPAGSFGSAAVT